MSHDPLAAAPRAPAPPPWGFLGTVTWGALGIAAWVAGQFLAVLVYLVIRDVVPPINARPLEHDGFWIAFVTIIAAPGWIAVAVHAARRRGWYARDYLALHWPRRGEIVFATICLVALLVALDLLSYGLGRDVVPRFMLEIYASARTSGSLVLLFVAIVVVSPIAEEIAFRGFLFRGLSESFVGVTGAIAVTSAGWAVMHVQYDVFTVAQIVLIGLLLGWLRWATGSTMLTIALHMLANLAACIQAAIVVERMS
jgi:membrane protease YdiL (CAAX protease family)